MTAILESKRANDSFVDAPSNMPVSPQSPQNPSTQQFPQSPQSPIAHTSIEEPPAYREVHDNEAEMKAGNEERPEPLKRKSTYGERFHKFSSKAGRPLNKAANAMGAEGWWPDSMEKECLKAARILYSFTNLDIDHPPRSHGPKHPTGLTRKSMVKIPSQVLQNCKGLVIFNTIRAGAWHGSFSGGSGVVVARRPDETWSPPSSFVISSLGGGLMLGLDVYDCVCVLNSQAQVDAFTSPRLSLGGNASIAVGPIGTGGAVNAAVSKTGRPMWSYIKSRGLWLGIQVDGTVVVSRNDANSVFYRQRGITAKDILSGDVAWPVGAKPLFEVLMALEGYKLDPEVVEEVISAPLASNPVVRQGDGFVAPPSPVPSDYVDVKYTDEKQGFEQKTQEMTQVMTQVMTPPAVDEKEPNLYESSVVDEKERLVKSEQ